MIQYLLLGMLALTVALLVARLYIAADPKQLALWTRRIGGLLSLLTAIWFLLSARYLFAVPFGFIGYVLLSRRTPLGGGGTGTQAGGGRTSSVRTAFIEMLLNHDTGAMHGTVLAGVFAGRELAALSHSDLLVLWRECRAAEPQSRQLLEAYLDRRWPEWREEQRRREQAGGARDEPSGERGGERGGPMSEAEALDILGLARGAGAEDIRNAHRNLMKRLHPDQGGTTYLAAKINEAKDVLLKSTRT